MVQGDLTPPRGWNDEEECGNSRNWPWGEEGECAHSNDLRSHFSDYLLLLHWQYLTLWCQHMLFFHLWQPIATHVGEHDMFKTLYRDKKQNEALVLQVLIVAILSFEKEQQQSEVEQSKRSPCKMKFDLLVPTMFWYLEEFAKGVNFLVQSFNDQQVMDGATRYNLV